jgi:hypothetical protein
LQHPSAMIVAAAASTSFCSAESFIFSSTRVGL